MKLVVTEKHDAAQKIAELLATGRPRADKVYSTPVYRFTVDGEEWVTIGLRGHILELDFTTELTYSKRYGWQGVDADGAKLPATLPKDLPRPPYDKPKRPFLANGVSFKSWRLEALPYLVYAPIEKLPKEKEIIRSLKNLAKKADSIVIATDFDREGELIGADALSCCREVNTTAPVARARYSAFTKAEITDAFTNLAAMDDDLAAAGGTRQDIDLIWGAVLTRYLTLVRQNGFGNVRPSGRVQTPTLALVVERERERLAFVPEDYWVIRGKFDTGAEVGPTDGQGDGAFEASHRTARFKSAEAADAVMAAIDGAHTATVRAIEKRTRKSAPPAPFNTTSLMAAASAEGLTPARTMRIAESLYMRGLISYPRVDNTVYPESLNLREIVGMLAQNPAYAPHCQRLLAQSQLHATRGKQQTTDHPPIYPTAAASPDTLAPADFKLYNLIARRFLATLSEAAVIEATKASLDVAGEEFVAKGDVLVKPGYRAIYPYGLKKDEHLPELAEGQSVAFNGATCEQKQTEPPARYSQGRLVQEMEKYGLGTKSTRASIIERLYAVKYLVNDPIEPSALGMAVIDALGKFAPRITHPEMTSELEEEMDSIAAGTLSADGVVANSRDLLAQQLGELMPHTTEIGEALADAVAADSYIGKCPKCGKDLQLKVSSKNKSSFIGCSGWPECDVTYPVPKGKIEAVEEPCPVCGMPQIKVTAFRSKPRTLCIDPECSSNQEPEVMVGYCPVCGAEGLDKKMYARRNPRTLKRSVTCENYDHCKTRYPLPQYGQITATEDVCEHCGAPIVIVNTSRGPWRLCPNFDCPGKEEKAKEKAAKPKAKSRRKTTRKKAAS